MRTVEVRILPPQPIFSLNAVRLPEAEYGSPSHYPNKLTLPADNPDALDFGANFFPDKFLESPRNWLRLMLTSAYRSGTGELEKQLDVSIIRRFDRFQIFHTRFTLFDQIGGTPSK
jgi:hypothetical protein